MEKISCIIVEDEPLAQDLLRAHIAKVSFLELVGICKNAIEARGVLLEKQPDLMFLDIEMPHLTGLDLLKTLPKPPNTVLTTAYSEHALTAFDLGVMDYLLKPIEFDRFFKSVSKVLEWLQHEPVSALSAVLPTHIFVKSDGRLVKVILTELLYAEALEKYVRLYLPHGRILSLMSMGQLMEMLPSEQFMRVHRSYIVNVSKVESVDGNTLRIGQKEIPLGKGQRAAVLARIS